MAGKLLPDELWNEIAPLFPEYEPSPAGGQPPVDHRTVLTCILFVLKTSIAWEDMPLELGCSYKTCQRRLKECNRLGLWDALHAHLLSRLRQADALDWSRALIDASFAPAPRGGQKPVRTRPIAENVGRNITC